MREIKFRAWDNDEKEMLQVGQIYFNSGSFWTPTSAPQTRDYLVRDVTLMQYTGLKDKNGKEVYEGDILLQSGAEKPTQVIWDEETASFTEFFLDYHADFEPYTAEVIGNIYENPELLE